MNNSDDIEEFYPTYAELNALINNARKPKMSQHHNAVLIQLDKDLQEQEQKKQQADSYKSFLVSTSPKPLRVITIEQLAEKVKKLEVKK